jgi:hypothetical protein
MGYETDKRFSPQNFAAKNGRASAPPRRVAAVGRSGGLATSSRKLHQASDAKNQYAHPVRSLRASRARVE